MVSVNSAKDWFRISVTEDQMEAYLELRGDFERDFERDEITIGDLQELFEESKITFGQLDEQINRITENPSLVTFPCLIAAGQPVEHGKDGRVDFFINLQSDLSIEEKEQLDFREVMKIPKVTGGEPILKMIPPTEGHSGLNVFGDEVKPQEGKTARVKAGKNTKWASEDILIATMDGQVSLANRSIQVLPTYEVNHDVDLRSGNIDFNGSVVIHGDIPSGFTVKAKGDIHVMGLVESAVLEAGGSIFIQKGISAVHKGMVRSGLDVHTKYINQGNVEAGRNIFVEQSILLSQCTARETIFCQSGSIIGGHLSAGQQIYVKDLGNRLEAETNIYLGENKDHLETLHHLEIRLTELNSTMNKLKQLGEKLNKIASLRGELTSNEKETLLKQEKSLRAATSEYLEIKKQLSEKKEKDVDFSQPVLYIHGILYPNSKVNFGKYQKNFMNQSRNVKIKLEDSEIKISPFH
ncbi:DUF342 domain-containing protein [Virgibacillus sp. MSP4-1]|uniref:DUF342 domain-containing protein n=1 Tax=Virgibacillus sp. MSP4-1 TaxID=2700081 RepID=UPI0003AAC516|nr:FapA family protein [Virgibacillus sp. MSP4-1]QHS22271.1 DUF342 domain-containing protein [Virgibacillus sp. MSP4-1]